jgi:hypothetical protein
VGGGVLEIYYTLPYQGDVFNYTGTLDIQGIDGGRQNKITTRFSSNAVTVKDAECRTFIPKRWELLGDFQHRGNSFTLMTNGTLW